MYFIILAITVFINVTLVAVPQDKPVFVTKIVKGRKCGHAKKRVLLALWFVCSSCVPRLFYARRRTLYRFKLLVSLVSSFF